MNVMPSAANVALLAKRIRSVPLLRSVHASVPPQQMTIDSDDKRTCLETVMLDPPQIFMCSWGKGGELSYRIRSVNVLTQVDDARHPVTLEAMEVASSAGLFVGDALGASEGGGVGWGVGVFVGAGDGNNDGELEGELDGSRDGISLGTLLGTPLG